MICYKFTFLCACTNYLRRLSLVF